MSISAATADADTALVKLPTILDLAAASSLQEATLRALAASGRLRLDASQVEVMLVPCLQLVLAAMRSANVSVEQPSQAFESAFADLGFDLQVLAAAATAMPVSAPQIEPQVATPVELAARFDAAS